MDIILEEQAQRYHGLVHSDDARYTELLPFGSAETYRLVYEPRGELLDWEQVDRIVVFDRESDDRLELYRVDDLIDAAETQMQDESTGESRSAK